MAETGSGEQLESLAASLTRARGDDLLAALAGFLAGILDAREVSICEAAPPRRTRPLATWREGSSSANHEYDLQDTPCADVYTGKTLLLDLPQEAYPATTGQRGAYFGMPLTVKDGAVLGHLCAWLRGPARLDVAQQALCAIVADRAAAELRLVHVKRERALLRAQQRQLRAEIEAAHDIGALVGTSAAHARLLEEIRRIASSGAAVLIRGEPGTGKELVARAVHQSSPRATRPFTRLDCASAGIESQLGALPQLCALTNGGTLFLDEVGALPVELQARLLAALPGNADRREPGLVDVRIIAATNRDLRLAMRDGNFREDLFYRLNVLPIDIPPLRARIEDIGPVVQYLVRRLSARLGRRIDSIDAGSLSELARHSWPGNMRELATLVERAMVTHGGPVLKLSADLFATASPAERAALIAAAAADTTHTRLTFAGTIDLDDTLNTGLHAVQREHILRVLNATHWVIEGNSGAALRLGMKPATLRHRMKKLGITRAQNQQAG